MKQIELHPNEGGTEWEVLLRDTEGGDSSSLGKKIETRGEALELARTSREDEQCRVEQELPDGTKVTVPCRIMLMRANGELYGELDHMPSATPENAQHFQMVPAEETGEAVNG